MTGGQQASGKKRTWFGRVFGNVGGSIGRRDYFIGVVLILLVSAALGHYFFMNRPDVFYTLNPDTPDAMKKLMFPAVTVPLTGSNTGRSWLRVSTVVSGRITSS